MDPLENYSDKMKKIARRRPILVKIWATIATGLFFLLPLLALFFVLGKVFSVAGDALSPLLKRIPEDTFGGLRTKPLLSLIVLMVLAYFIGLLARFAIARNVNSWLEDHILSSIPGYEFFKNMGRQLLGLQTEREDPVVIVNFDDNSQIGFLVEKLENGHFCVFIPGAPNPNSGGVFLVDAERVVFADATMLQTMKTLRRMGVGSDALFGKLKMKYP